MSMITNAQFSNTITSVFSSVVFPYKFSAPEDLARNRIELDGEVKTKSLETFKAKSFPQVTSTGRKGFTYSDSRIVPVQEKFKYK